MQSTLAFTPKPEDLDDLDLDSAILTFAPLPRTEWPDALLEAACPVGAPVALQAEAN